jgi:hypothetical protein
MNITTNSGLQQHLSFETLKKTKLSFARSRIHYILETLPFSFSLAVSNGVNLVASCFQVTS